MNNLRSRKRKGKKARGVNNVKSLVEIGGELVEEDPVWGNLTGVIHNIRYISPISKHDWEPLYADFVVPTEDSIPSEPGSETTERWTPSPPLSAEELKEWNRRIPLRLNSRMEYARWKRQNEEPVSDLRNRTRVASAGITVPTTLPDDVLELMDDNEAEFKSRRSRAFPLMYRRGPLLAQNKAWWVDEALQPNHQIGTLLRGRILDSDPDADAFDAQRLWQELLTVIRNQINGLPRGYFMANDFIIATAKLWFLEQDLNQEGKVTGFQRSNATFSDQYVPAFYDYWRQYLDVEELSIWFREQSLASRSPLPRLNNISKPGVDRTEGCDEQNEQDVFPDFERGPYLYAPLLIKGRRVLAVLDSGATHSYMSSRTAAGLKISAVATREYAQLANGQKISVEGRTGDLTVTCGDRAEVVNFAILPLADDVPILIGLDLFPLFGFEISNVPVLFPDTNSTLQEELITPEELVVYKEEEEELDAKLREELKQVLERNQNLPPSALCNVPESVVVLETGNNKPSFIKQYPIPRNMLPILETEIQSWIDKRQVIPSPPNTAWNSPLLVVPKKDPSGNIKGWRPCIDPRAINKMLSDDNHPLALKKDIFNSLPGFKIASTLDLEKGFHQFKIRDSDREKTTFTWKGTQWMFNVAPFGLKTLPAIFQRVMQRLLGHLPYVAVYIDDIVVFSRSWKEHLEHMEVVINILTEANLKLQLKKCYFARSSFRLLGHIVTTQGVAPCPEKLKRIRTWKRPSTGLEVMSFMGFINFLSDMVPKMSQLCEPINHLRYHKKISEKDWTLQCEESFQAIKKVLKECPFLHFPDFSKEFYVATDASSTGLGAVLYQIVDSKIQYVQFTAKSLSPAARKYSATKRELLGIVFALEAFRFYLWGKHFTLFTDHRALTFLFTQKQTNPMLNRWMEVLLDFNFSINHRPGMRNVLPDRLSRLYPTFSWNQEDPSGIILNMPIAPKENDDWKLNPILFKHLNNIWGPHTVDLFATSVNAQLPKFYTKENSAFVHNWHSENGWANPPWSVIDAVIDKVITDQATITIVTPWWPSKTWFKRLTQMSTADPILLKHGKDLFLPASTRNSVGVGAPNWSHTAAWRISGMNGDSRPAPKMEELRILEIQQGEDQTIRVLQVASARPKENRSVGDFPLLIEVLDEQRQKEILQTVHDFGHFGAEAMTKRIREQGYTWSTLRKDADTLSLNCPQCRRYNYGKVGFHPLKNITAKYPMDHLAIDFAGPFPVGKDGFVILLVIVDICTRMCFLRPLTDKTAFTVAKALINLFCDFGFPKILQSDNDPSFANAVIEELMKQTKVEHRFVTPYNPRGNGTAERFVQTAKQAIFKSCDGALHTWSEMVPFVQLAMNLNESRRTGSSAFALFFARHFNDGFSAISDDELNAPVLSEDELLKRFTEMRDVVFPAISERVRSRTSAIAAKFDATKKLAQFPDESFVMLRNPNKKLLGDPTWTGPFKVLKKTKGGSYVLEGLDGALLPRNAAASQLKSVSHVDNEERAKFEAIVNHRKTPQGFEYLVKWHRLSAHHNSWLKPSDFDDVSDIQAYWKRRKPGKIPKPQSSTSQPVRLRLVGGHVDALNAQSSEPRPSVPLKRKRTSNIPPRSGNSKRKRSETSLPAARIEELSDESDASSADELGL